MTEQRKYDDATRGATRYPPQTGDEHSGRRDERDPHERLTRPVSEVEAEAERDAGIRGGPVNDVTGMGGAGQGGEGTDPVLAAGGSRGDREERAPGQSTPRGEPDAEAEAVRRAEEATGVPLEDPPQ